MTLRKLSIRDTLLWTLGGLALLIGALVAARAWTTWQSLRAIRANNAAATVSDRLFVAMVELERERRISAAFLYAGDPASRHDVREHLEECRREADQALRAALVSPRRDALGRTDPIASRRSLLQQARARIDAQAEHTVPDDARPFDQGWYRDLTELIGDIEGVWLELNDGLSHLDATSALQNRFKHNLREIGTQSDREHEIVAYLIALDRRPTASDHAALLEAHGSVNTAWSLSTTLLDEIGSGERVLAYLEDARSHYETLHDMVRDPFYLPSMESFETYPIAPELWLELSLQLTDSLHALRAVFLDEVARRQRVLEDRAIRSMWLQAAVLLVAAGLCGASLYVIRCHVLAPVHKMIEALLHACRETGIALDPSESDQINEIGRLRHVLRAFQMSSRQIHQKSQELEIYAHALERSNNELDDFAYIASHDLKEPLRGIHNHSRFLLEDNEGKLDPKSVERIQRLIYLSQRMEQLVNDLLYFSRIGRQELAYRDADLEQIVHDIEATLETLVRESKAKIRIVDRLPHVYCDATRVTEVFLNLITNAIKYNDKEEKLVEIGFHPKGALRDRSIVHDVFYVRDNGLGIAPEFHDDVFRIFRRLQPRTKASDGTGVGLTFVKKIIERHGGRIWLESRPGQGTTFYFTLEGESA